MQCCRKSKTELRPKSIPEVVALAVYEMGGAYEDMAFSRQSEHPNQFSYLWSKSRKRMEGGEVGIESDESHSGQTDKISTIHDESGLDLSMIIGKGYY